MFYLILSADRTHVTLKLKLLNLSVWQIFVHVYTCTNNLRSSFIKYYTYLATCKSFGREKETKKWNFIARPLVKFVRTGPVSFVNGIRIINMVQNYPYRWKYLWKRSLCESFRYGHFQCIYLRISGIRNSIVTKNFISGSSLIYYDLQQSIYTWNMKVKNCKPSCAQTHRLWKLQKMKEWIWLWEMNIYFPRDSVPQKIVNIFHIHPR